MQILITRSETTGKRNTMGNKQTKVKFHYCARVAGQTPLDQWPARQPWTDPDWEDTLDNYFCFAYAQATTDNPNGSLREDTLRLYSSMYRARNHHCFNLPYDHMEIFYKGDPFVRFTADLVWLQRLMRYRVDTQLMAYHAAQWCVVCLSMMR